MDRSVPESSLDQSLPGDPITVRDRLDVRSWWIGTVQILRRELVLADHATNATGMQILRAVGWFLSDHPPGMQILQFWHRLADPGTRGCRFCIFGNRSAVGRPTRFFGNVNSAVPGLALSVPAASCEKKHQRNIV